MNSEKKIGCIIVLYNPDLLMLYNILNRITNQVSIVYIVDNSIVDNNFDFSNYCNVVFDKLGKNIGIASAQNIGLKFFQERNFD